MSVACLLKVTKEGFAAAGERRRIIICYPFGIAVERPVSLEDIAVKLGVTPNAFGRLNKKH